MKSNLKSEMEFFKTEILDCIRHAHTNMNSKFSETEKQLSSKTPGDKNQIQKVKTKINWFFLELMRNPSTETTTFVEGSATTRKWRRDCTVLWNWQNHVFRLGKFDEAAQRTRPIVVKLPNPLNNQLLLIWNQKLKAQKIFVKAFLSKNDWEKEQKLLDSRFKFAQKLNINRSEFKIGPGALFVENQIVDITLSEKEICQKIGHQTISSSSLEEKQVLKIELVIELPVNFNNWSQNESWYFTEGTWLWHTLLNRNMAYRWNKKFKNFPK